jgi:predicted HicB family RNase H-like nuclease
MDKRLNLQIDEELLKEIKKRAINRNITLRKWVLRAIKQAIKYEEQYE